MDLDKLVDEKIAADSEFQTSLEALGDDEKDEAIKTKRAEVLSSEFSEQTEKTTKAEKIAADQKIRAEKAEAEAKALREGNGEAAPATVQLSASDMLALSKVHEDDIERVEKFAKDEGVSIREALKNSELKAILGVREETRDSAAAAHVGPSRRGSVALSDDALMAKANSGADLTDDELQKVMQVKQKEGR